MTKNKNMNTEIIEGNKLIAEYMGEKLSGPYGYKITNIPSYWSNVWLFENLQYNYSWDWIVPVVEKIKKTHNLYIEYEIIEAALCRFQIEEVWIGVVEFIKWHNKPKSVKFNYGI